MNKLWIVAAGVIGVLALAGCGGLDGSYGGTGYTTRYNYTRPHSSGAYRNYHYGGDVHHRGGRHRDNRSQGRSDVFSSDGTVYRTRGNNTFGSDGTGYHRNGNTIFGTNGVVYQRQGDNIFASDGTVYHRNGDFIYGSNGKIYYVDDF